MFVAGVNMKTSRGWRSRTASKPVHVCRADASYSQAKLMRMKKVELKDACKEYRLEEAGTKATMVERLMDHFSQLDEGASEESETREVYVAAQAAAPVAAPLRVPPARVERKTADDLNMLIARVDTAIEAKTSELEKKRVGDREQAQALLKELSGVKQEWQQERAQVQALLDELASAQQGMDQTHVDVEQLTAQQRELQEAQEALRRMIKARDEEVHQLRTQLQTMREQQAQAGAAQSQERLAMLALASSVAATESAVAPEAKRAQLPVASERYQTVAPQAMQADAGFSPRSANAPSVASKKIGIYGMAMPALFACALMTNANKTYSEYRNIALPAKLHAVADVAVLSAVVATIAAVCT